MATGSKGATIFDMGRWVHSLDPGALDPSGRVPWRPGWRFIVGGGANMCGREWVNLDCGHQVPRAGLKIERMYRLLDGIRTEGGECARCPHCDEP